MMSRESTQQKVMSAIADIIEASDLTVAEKIGVLGILQTTFVMAAASNK